MQPSTLPKDWSNGTITLVGKVRTSIAVARPDKVDHVGNIRDPAKVFDCRLLHLETQTRCLGKLGKEYNK